ncbi:ribosome-associated translation inhibitor RaiA [Patescibacteria group bacterium]|nr:ribosome-associated translation inhibitor RaiA [Patescibacteria group bacterium]
MHINIKATHITLTPEASEYLDKRLASLEKLVDPNDTSAMADVEVGKTTMHHQSGDVFRAEINIRTAGKQFRAVAEEGTLYSAIDKARDEILREMRRNKQKRLHLLKRSGAKVKEFTRDLQARGVHIKKFLRRKK